MEGGTGMVADKDEEGQKNGMVSLSLEGRPECDRGEEEGAYHACRRAVSSGGVSYARIRVSVVAVRSPR